MSNYKKQEFDFIKRTKAIIKQYDDFNIVGKEKFEITLLLNCMVGLLILPQQHWFKILPTELISKKEWGIDTNYVSLLTKRKKTVKEISRHIRNSISHYTFKAFANTSNKITKIKFEDFARNGEKTFEAIIPVIDLKVFAEKFSMSLINQMTKNK